MILKPIYHVSLQILMWRSRFKSWELLNIPTKSFIPQAIIWQLTMIASAARRIVVLRQLGQILVSRTFLTKVAPTCTSYAALSHRRFYSDQDNLSARLVGFSCLQVEMYVELVFLAVPWALSSRKQQPWYLWLYKLSVKNIFSTCQ